VESTPGLTTTPDIVGFGEVVGCPDDWRPAVFALGSTTPSFDMGPTQPTDDTSDPTLVAAHKVLYTDTSSAGRVRSYERPAGVGIGVCPSGFGGVGCDPSDFQVGWRDGTWLRRDATGGGPEETQVTTARAIDEVGFVVGCYHLPLAGNSCSYYPSYWDNPTGGVAYVSPIPPLPVPGTANATTEGTLYFSSCDRHRIVGWELDPVSPFAIVWDQCDDGSWCVHYIDDLSVSSTQISSPQGTIAARKAYETNSLGHTVVVVDGTALLPRGGCATTPSRCVGVVTAVQDLNGDFRVSAPDLSLLLGAWGATAACAVDGADLDESGTVDATDLAIPLGAWSTTPVPIPWPCSAFGECGEMAVASYTPLSQEGIALAIALLGFGSMEEFVEWGSTADLETLGSVGETILAIANDYGGGA